jgi:uncharacterized protein involved in exopolysaccharide biosynthesis
MIESEVASQPMSLAALASRVWQAIRKHRREFLIAAVSTVALIQAAAFFWPGTFAAQAAVMIHKARQEAQMEPSVSNGPTLIVGAVSKEDVLSEIAIMTSHEVFSATVEAIGLDRVRPPWYLRLLFAPLHAYEYLYASYHGVRAPTATDRAIRSLSRSISAERMKDSNVLVFTLEAKNPDTAKVVLEELMRQYQKRHLIVHGQNAAEPFFEAQTQRVESDIAAYQQKLQDLEEKADVVDFDSELNSQLRLDAELREEEANLVRNLAELSGSITNYNLNLKRELDQRKETITKGDNALAMGNLSADVLNLEIELIRLEARYEPNSPPVVEARAKLAAARQRLESSDWSRVQESRTEENPTSIALRGWLAKAEGERAGALQRLQTLTNQLAQSSKRLRELDKGRVTAGRVNRQLTSAQHRYMTYLERRDAAVIDQALDRGQFTNISVVQDATASPRPIRPRKLLALVISLIGGLVSGILVCVLLESERLDLPSIFDAIVPKEVTGS